MVDGGWGMADGEASWIAAAYELEGDGPDALDQRFGACELRRVVIGDDALIQDNEEFSSILNNVAKATV